MTCTTPGPDDLPLIVDELARWQPPGGSVTQLHPGDVGWFQRFGAERTAAALRRWSRDGTALAIGLLDEPDYLRLAFAPAALEDSALAAEIAGELEDMLVGGTMYVDPPTSATALRSALSGWTPDAPWVPLHRELAEPVPDAGLDVSEVTVATAAERVAVQRASFDGSTFTEDRWHAMAAGPAFMSARCLLGRSPDGAAVAAITVWSAGPGQPGILEPMGVHRGHRGNGYGTAITLAGAAALRDLGASGASVATPATNTGAVATYAAAGFTPEAQTRALIRPE